MARSASLRESAEVNGSLDEPGLAVELDRIEQARFEAEQGLTTSGLLLLLSIVLFALHWRWLRSRDARIEEPRGSS